MGPRLVNHCVSTTDSKVWRYWERTMRFTHARLCWRIFNKLTGRASGVDLLPAGTKHGRAVQRILKPDSEREYYRKCEESA